MIQIPIAEIYLAFLALTRITALFFLVPIFSMSGAPFTVRLAFAGIIAIMLVPMIENTPVIPTHLMGLVVALAGEILVGMLMGFAARMLFYALELATDLIARDAALMRASSFDPTTETQGTVLTPLYFFLALMVFVITGVHLEIIAALVRSFDFVPAGMGVFGFSGIDYITREFSMIFELGLRMSAPIMAMAFVLNMLFAILGKVAAKVNVLVLSFGIRIMFSLLLLFLSVNLMLRFILNGFEGTGLKMLEFLVAN